MARLLLFFVNLVTITLVQGSSKSKKIDLKAEIEVGDPLFLTPYIESGDIAIARNLAEVSLTEETLRIKSYSGYFTVNKTYDSNHFFWYFPAMSHSKEAPVLVWLQGGPGASSLTGLFTETGPIKIRNKKFQHRVHNWALNHHIIYIDNPVGTGFSFTKHHDGYCTNANQIGEQLYSSVSQFFQLFPELQKNRFFVTGESYGCKHITALAHTIHKKNPKAQVQINLKGMSIANGLCDPVNQLQYGKYLQQIGLIDSNQARIFEKHEAQVAHYIQNEEWAGADDALNSLIRGDKSVFYNMTGFEYYFNYLHTTNYLHSYKPMVQTNVVRKAIHVGHQIFHDGVAVKKHLKEDKMKSAAPWLSELLDYYDIAILNGQLDIRAAYPLTENFLSNLNFTGSEDYKTAERHIWRVDGEVAGYVKKAGKLTEVLVRNAGHMVPADQPKWALELIKTLAKPIDLDFMSETESKGFTDCGDLCELSL